MLNNPNATSTQLHKRDAGFSLVEVLVAVSIMAVMATAIVVYVAPLLGKSNITRAKADIQSLDSALDQYNFDMNAYPTIDLGLNALITAPADGRTDQYRPGGYIKRLEQDPWGNPYIYTLPATRSGRIYDLYSAGPDGQPGNADDIGNWAE